MDMHGTVLTDDSSPTLNKNIIVIIISYNLNSYQNKMPLLKVGKFINLSDTKI